MCRLFVVKFGAAIIGPCDIMLTRLQIVNLRNIVSQQIDGLSGVNVFLGNNGAGKTSILEAIHTLGSGRSFRKQGGQKDALVRYGCERLVVFGEKQTCADEVGKDEPISAERLGLSRAVSGDIQIKVNGEKLYRLSDMALRLPAISLNSDTVDLLTGGSAERRRYIDWAVFHVEHEFREISKRYGGALQQRNSVLRKLANKHGDQPGALAEVSPQDAAQLDVWTRAVAELGSKVAAYREQQFLELKKLFNQVLEELDACDLGVTLSYRSGWGQGSDLGAALEQGMQGDIKRGFTQSGPHRADLQVLVGKEVAGQARLARDVLSRGQLELVVLAMKVAQVLFFQQGVRRKKSLKGNQVEGSFDISTMQPLGRSNTLVLLLDDVAAEFDSSRVTVFGRVLAKILTDGGVQIFATSTALALLEPLLKGLPAHCHKVFHVEHGVVSVVE